MPDSKGTGGLADVRGQVRDQRLFFGSRGGEGGEAGRWSWASTYARPMNGSRRTGACQASSDRPPNACMNDS